MTTPHYEEAAGLIEKVLSEHRSNRGSGDCICGWVAPWNLKPWEFTTVKTAAAHVTQRVLDALLSSGLLPKLAIEAGQLEQVGWHDPEHGCFWKAAEVYDGSYGRVFVLRETEEPT